MALPVGALIRIDTSIAGVGGLRTRFGTGLLITTDDTIAAGGAGKMQIFSDMNAVNSIFDAGDVVDAAAVWFGAVPRPEALYVGRWAATADVDTALVGDDGIGALSTLTVSSASFSVGGEDVTVDLSGDTTYAEAAAGIQAALILLGGIFTGASFTYVTDHFELELDDGSAIEGGGFEAHSAGTGTDISSLLGMRLTDGAVYKQGHAVETISAAVAEMVGLATNGVPVALMLADDAPLTFGTPVRDTRDDMRAFAQAGDYMFGQRDTADQALVTNDATSKSALAFSGQIDKMLALYSKDGENPEIAALAALSAQNLSQPASIITLHTKPMPGVEPTDITETEYAELKRKRTNVYTTWAGVPAFIGGTTPRTGYWADAVWWLLWIKHELEQGIFETMRGSRRMTNAQLLNTIMGVMEMGVQNGGIQPGRKVSTRPRARTLSKRLASRSKTACSPTATCPG